MHETAATMCAHTRCSGKISASLKQTSPTVIYVKVSGYMLDQASVCVGCNDMSYAHIVCECIWTWAEVKKFM